MHARVLRRCKQSVGAIEVQSHPTTAPGAVCRTHLQTPDNRWQHSWWRSRERLLLQA